jgi:hypothetical protein
MLALAWMIAFGIVTTGVLAGSYRTPNGDLHTPGLLLVNQGIYCFGPGIPQAQIGSSIVVAVLNRMIFFRAFGKNVFIEFSPKAAITFAATAVPLTIPPFFRRSKPFVR